MAVATSPGGGICCPHISSRVSIEPRPCSLTTGPEAQPGPLLGKMLTSLCLSFLICQTRRTTGSLNMSRSPLGCTQARRMGDGSRCPGHSCDPFPGLTEVYMCAQGPGGGDSHKPRAALHAQGPGGDPANPVLLCLQLLQQGSGRLGGAPTSGPTPTGSLSFPTGAVTP